MESPSESNRRVWIIVGVASLLMIVAAIVGIAMAGSSFLKRANARHEQMARLEKNRREFLKEAESAIAEGRPTDDAGGRLKQLGETMGNAAETSTGNEKKSLKAAQRVIQSMAPSLAKYEAAYKELLGANFVDPTTLRSRQKIAERVAIVKRFDSANDELTTMVNGMEARVRSELQSEGITGHAAEQVVAGFMSTADLDLNRTIRKCDSELADSVLKMLGILDREWGSWEVESGSVAFRKKELNDEYNTEAEKVKDVAERQVKAQQELLSRARARQK